MHEMHLKMRAAQVRLSTHCAMEWQSLFRKGKLNNYCLYIVWGCECDHREFVWQNGVRKKEREHMKWSEGLDCGAFFRRIKLTCAALGLQCTESALTHAIAFAWQIDCDHTTTCARTRRCSGTQFKWFRWKATIVCPFWQYRRMWFFKLFSRNNYHRWMHAHWYGHARLYK